jgi:hypothetical protein
MMKKQYIEVHLRKDVKNKGYGLFDKEVIRKMREVMEG